MKLKFLAIIIIYYGLFCIFPSTLVASPLVSYDSMEEYETKLIVKFTIPPVMRELDPETLMEDIISAEELNTKGLKLLNSSCGFQEYKEISEILLPFTGFKYVENMLNYCIKSKDLLKSNENNKIIDYYMKNAQTTAIDQVTLPFPFLAKKQFDNKIIGNRAKQLEKEFFRIIHYYWNILREPKKRIHNGIVSDNEPFKFLNSILKHKLYVINDPVKTDETIIESIQSLESVFTFNKSIAHFNLQKYSPNTDYLPKLNKDLIRWYEKRNKNIQNNPHIRDIYKKTINNHIQCLKNIKQSSLEKYNFLMFAGFYQDYGIKVHDFKISLDSSTNFKNEYMKRIFQSHLFQRRSDSLLELCQRMN